MGLPGYMEQSIRFWCVLSKINGSAPAIFAATSTAKYTEGSMIVVIHVSSMFFRACQLVVLE